MLKKLIKYPTDFGLNQQIDLMNEKQKKEYCDSKLENMATINPSSNNGLFSIGTGLSFFKLKFESASNDIARIYNDYGDVKIGRLNGFSKFEEIESIEDIEIQNIDFSSRVVDFKKSTLGIVVNQYDKCLLLEFKVIESESHGCSEDKLSFVWKVLSK